MQDKKFWEKYFTVYDYLNHLIPYQDLIENVVEGLDIKEGDKVLDAGCGTGNLAKKLSQKGADVVCADNSDEALNICNKKHIKNVNTLCIDITQPLPFRDEEFDRVILNNVLYTIPLNKHTQVMENLCRVLRSDGEIVVTNPKKGWSAISIYKEGIKKGVNKKGLRHTIVLCFKLFIPTLKILYYNMILRKESSNYFFDEGEQEKLLKKTGFNKIKLSKSVYADQSYLVVAVKQQKQL